MITSTLSILLAVVGISGLLVAVALFIKVNRVNSEEFTEVRRLQGGVSNVLSGRLKNTPNEYGDYRIVRGLKWDRKSKRYISQSGLSSEGLRAAFPK